MVALSGVLLGTVLVVVGVLAVRHARAITRFEERIDAIGSNRNGASVEPAEWNVTFTRVLGACLAAFGTVVLLLALLD